MPTAATAVASTSMLLVLLTGILSASLLLADLLGRREVLALAPRAPGGVVRALQKS